MATIHKHTRNSVNNDQRNRALMSLNMDNLTDLEALQNALLQLQAQTESNEKRIAVMELQVMTQSPRNNSAPESILPCLVAYPIDCWFSSLKIAKSR